MNARKTLARFGIPAAALLIGIGMGSAGGHSQPAADTPTPTQTVTVPGPTQTVTTPGPTKTVSVPGPTITVTPSACTDALDKADKVIADSAQAMQYEQQGWDAASRFDSAGIESSAQQIKALAPKVGDDKAAYNTAADACRGK
jgi:hypothetical protein